MRPMFIILAVLFCIFASVSVQNAYAATNSTVFINANLSVSQNGTGAGNSTADTWFNNTVAITACTNSRNYWFQEKSTHGAFNQSCDGKGKEQIANWTAVFNVNSSMSNPDLVTLNFNSSWFEANTGIADNYRIMLTFPNGTNTTLFTNSTSTVTGAWQTPGNIGLNVSGNFTGTTGNYNLTLFFDDKTAAPGGQCPACSAMMLWSDIELTFKYTAGTTVIYTFSNITQSITFKGLNDTSAASDSRTNIQSLTFNGLNDTSLASHTDTFSLSIALKNTITSVMSAARSLSNTITFNLSIQKLFPKILSLSATFSNRITSIAADVRNLVQSITTLSNIQKLFPKLSTLQITLNNSMTRIASFVRNLTNALTLNNFTTRLASFIRNLSNAITFNNLISSISTFARKLTNAITFNFNLQKLFPKLLNLNITIANRLTSISAFTRSITNTFTLKNLTTSISSFIRSLSSTISFSNFVTKAVTLAGSVTNKTVSLVVTLSNRITSVFSASRNLSLTSTFNNVITRVSSLVRNLSNTLTFTQNIQKLFPKLVAVPITIINKLTSLSTFVRSLSNTITLSPITTRVASFVRNLTNALTLNNFTTRLASFIRNLSNAITFNNLISSISTFARKLTNAITFNFNLQKLFPKLLNLNITIANRLTSISAFTRSITNTLTFTQNIQKLFPKILSLPITISNRITSISSLIRNLGNTISLSNLITKVASFPRSLVNTITFSNPITRVVSLIRSLTNSITLQSAIQKLFPKNLSNAISLTPITTRLASFTRSLSNTITLSNLTTRLASLVRNLTNQITLTPLTTRIASLFRNLSNTITLSNVMSKILPFARNISNTITLNNLTTRIQIFTRQLTNIISFTNLSSRIASFIRLLTSVLNLIGNVLIPSNQNPSPTPSPSPSGGGGISSGGSLGGAVVYPSGPVQDVNFLKFPVVEELLPGQSIDENIQIKNIANNDIKGLKIQIDGLPQDWVSVSPASLDIKSSQSVSFNVHLSVPANANNGDNKVLVKLTDSASQEQTDFILRVKSYTLEDRPIIFRNVNLDYTAKRTYVTLKLSNPVNINRSLVQVVEQIPKSLASNVNGITFSPNPDKIIQSDPTVEWDVNLPPLENKIFSYSVDGILQDYTTYQYFPVQELNTIQSTLPLGFRLVELKLPFLSTGIGEGRLVIQNLNNDTKRMEFSLQLPTGWKMNPDKIVDSIGPGEKKEFKFSIAEAQASTLTGQAVLTKASLGSNIAYAIFVWGEDTYIREVVVTIGGFSFVTVIIFVILVVGVVGGYFIYKSRQSQDRSIALKLRSVVDRIRQRRYSYEKT